MNPEIYITHILTNEINETQKAAVDLSRVLSIYEDEFQDGTLAVRVNFDTGEHIDIADTFEMILKVWSNYKNCLE